MWCSAGEAAQIRADQPPVSLLVEDADDLSFCWLIQSILCLNKMLPDRRYELTYTLRLFNRMCAQVAPSGECLRGKSRPDWMLAIPWRRLFLATYTIWAKPSCLLLSCVTVCVSCHCCPAWQTVIRCIISCVRLSCLS